jgi:GTP-binding protein
VDPGLSDLTFYRHRRLFRAEKGGSGRNKKMYGKNGEDLILPVPAGTLVFAIDESGEHTLLADLKQTGEEVMVAKGGHGGRGNIHFKSSTNQAPQQAEDGKPGYEVILVLDVRIIADAGILGEPNAGKSTLLAAATAANPKIADYPFTTIEPMLGMVEIGLKTFVLAEIPGLIEGAHAGRGLGYDFLRHAMRTRVVIHLIDGSAENPVQVMERLNNELMLFDPVLAAKPQLTVVNKIDLPEVRERIDAIRQAFRDAGREVFFISAAMKEGVNELMAETLKLIESLPEEKEEALETPVKVFRPKSKG